MHRPPIALRAFTFTPLHFIFMRELEAKVTKEAEEKQSRSLVQEKEEQLMEERRKRKDEKKKKEAALKKATEQKSKVPEPTKPSSSQPPPANCISSTSPVTSNISNAKRVSASNQQQASPRYPPREVPPRFRNHEQKQLLKRVQQLPAPGVELGGPGSNGAPSLLSVNDGQLLKSNENCAGMPPIRDLVSHSPNQSDLNHSGLGSHYENSHWVPGSAGSDSSTTWDRVIVDGCDKEAWPSITGSDPELASECIDADSTSSSGSEKNLSIMASASSAGIHESTRNSSQSQQMVGNVSNNVSNGSINGPWDLPHGSVLSTHQGSVEGINGKLHDNSHSNINMWSSPSSASSGGINPSTLNPNANHGAWCLLEGNGNKAPLPVGNGSNGSNLQRSTVDQQNSNSTSMCVSSRGSWNSLHESTDSDVGGTRKVSFSGQPQNLNTEMNGPNNTTNMLTSSLPNSTGSLQTSELPNVTGHRAWRMSTVTSQLQASSVSNGTSASQHSSDEGVNSDSYGTSWATPGTNYSGDKCQVLKGQAIGDTVNATLMQTTPNSSVGQVSCKNNNVGCGRGGLSWDQGTANSHREAWGTGNSYAPSGRAWANGSLTTGNNVSSMEWSELPNTQHSSDNDNNRKGSNGCGQSSTLSQISEQNDVWVKSPSTPVESEEGSTESTGSRNEKASSDGHRARDRRKADPQGLVQNVLSRTDLDPRVLSNIGWGQTPIRQHTAWDIETSKHTDKKTDNGTEAWGGIVSQTCNSGGWDKGPSPNTTNASSLPGWGDAKGSSSQGGWDDSASAASGTVKNNQTWNKEDKSSTWNDAQKVKQGWSEGPKSHQNWGPSTGGEGWGEVSSTNQWGSEPVKSGSGGWDRDSDSDRSVSGWSEPGRTASSANTWANGGTGSTSGWGEPSKDSTPSQGWDNASKSSTPSLGWVEQSKGSTTAQNWEEQLKGSTPSQGWGEPKKGSTPSLGWGEQSKGSTPSQSWDEVTKVSSPPLGWGEQSKGSASTQSWGESSKINTPSQNWVESSKACSSTLGWGEQSKGGPMPQGWGEQAKSVTSQGWGDQSKGGSSAHGWGDQSKPGNSSEWKKPQEIAGGSASWGGDQPSPANNKPSGWLEGPMPSALKDDEPTGWEEPSPESIRRKMEIDDGTSAWGDPNQYKYKNVNMWNKNTVNGSSGSEQEASMPQPPQQLLPPGPPPPPNGLLNKEGSGNTGWGEPYGIPTKTSASWGEPALPLTTVDNGTAAWGKPLDTGASWGEGVNGDSASTPAWTNVPVGQQPQSKTGSKAMQEGWCADEITLSESRHPSWEMENDGEFGTWNSHPSQEINQPSNCPPYLKKAPVKNSIKGGGKPDDVWMNQFVKQFSSIGFPRESCEESKSGKIDLAPGILSDKRVDVEYNGVIGKGPSSRLQVPKESSMERSPYYDKLSLSSIQDGGLAEETPSVHFASNQNLKLLPSNNALPNQVLGSVTGLGIQNLNSVRQNGNPSVFNGSPAAQVRGMPQPPAQPINSSQPNLRAQVPPPLLSPQVPASLLKYPPNNGGINPMFGAQQVAMLNQLSQLSQLSQISQLQRLLLQQQKAQSHRSSPSSGRQLQDPQGRSLNMPPQMMQAPRSLDATLMKQAAMPQLHQPSMKSFLENLMPHNTPELQKELPAHGSFSSFPLGLNSNLNVNNLDIGSIKEPQSRLKKWTALDNMPVTSSLDQNSSKPGAISTGLRLDESPFGPYDFINRSNSPVSSPGSVGDSWAGRAKSPNGSTNVNWPPEFRPGEPWKGYPNIDPETDPYVTPGSVINNLSINTVRDVEHLRDRSNGSTSSLNTSLPSTSAWSSIRASNFSGSLSCTAQSTSARNSDSKSTWSPGPVTNTSLAHELWKVPLPPKNITAPSRPPPGLTGQKPPSSWESSSLRLGGWGTLDSRYNSGSTWGENGSGRTTNWLVLKNLTPQIDGSTLRTLCMQHGPLITFHLNLPHGNALVRYSSKEEAAKAQKSLHMCVLGNTTILAEFASEEEINRFFAQGQSMTPSPAWQNRMGSVDGSHSFSNRNDLNHWNGAGLAGAGSMDLHGTSLWATPSYSTNLWGAPGNTDTRVLGSPSPINAFLPVDHLAGGAESM
ncbi:trinucleotide repeat-containing gene 6A protein-like [Erpetoichthys calabaricus]|uniref:trinucleotide repeat-containing gene 6A protein-like n=1 Tax=Erpetoichthys calabaricus TaxID=27687 RepID=UPI002233E58A|nr:trinucleotide repeat-containing gene 6A protein-like [Erpetoichthys calabaricus]